MTSRRHWLKQASFTMAALGLGDALQASPSGPHPVAPGILLNSNENAYGPSERTRKAMSEAIGWSNRYPDEQIPLLKNKLAAFWKVERENILMGAGSSEILALVSILMARQKGNVITAEPSYRVWNNQAEQCGLSFIRVPLTEDRKLDLPKMLGSVNGETRMVYICNPNNPTGTYIDYEKLRQFVIECSKKCTVLVDEAYTEFAGLPSLAPEAVGNPNLIVAKTFSKIYGLAGARVGYAIAHPATIKTLASLQAWPDVAVSQVSAAAASAALDDQAFVQFCRDRTRESRDMCYAAFRDLKLDYIPSATSFILFNIEPIKCDYAAAMEKKNIFVQYRQHFGGKWCRVSMGTTEEMKTFCASLRQICS